MRICWPSALGTLNRVIRVIGVESAIVVCTIRVILNGLVVVQSMDSKSYIRFRAARLN